ncbi:uncharacterized protein BO97DRAFT_406826 [Aspergillus homomorphus CBS 101889]|uniref:Uncharacterized protein n=1 Tax=Aspergillus homomorphus (strain CBS 101889) TaxID=1450537 RepID=A0A395HWH3_ASPHC|nr:hypothetical protein BO97DRAFT_406826 [Aspergillus homomorphus CBS 101889]RAL10574.1 hypothetical protein BO97DRAFT_406826 [Aspergillus homomorphus CBS 101889]
MAYPDVTIYLRRAGGRPEQVRLLSDYVETQADGTPGGLSYVRFLEDLKKSLNCKSAEKIYIQVLDITTGFGSKAQSITSEGLWVGALLTTVRYNGGPIEFVVSLERPKPVRERAPLPEARQLPAPPTAPQDKRPGTPRPGPVQAVTAEGKGTSSLVPLAPKPPVAAAVPANPSAAAPEKEPAILPLKASSVPSSLHNILILS